MSQRQRPRKIIYTPEQLQAIAAVAEIGAALEDAREVVAATTEEARETVRYALMLGIHYKELKGLSPSFTYRVLSEMNVA